MAERTKTQTRTINIVELAGSINKCNTVVNFKKKCPLVIVPRLCFDGNISTIHFVRIFLSVDSIKPMCG